jgi:hypothetical protein
LTVEVRTVFYGETQALLVRSEKAKPHPTTAAAPPATSTIRTYREALVTFGDEQAGPMTVQVRGRAERSAFGIRSPFTATPSTIGTRIRRRSGVGCLRESQHVSSRQRSGCVSNDGCRALSIEAIAIGRFPGRDRPPSRRRRLRQLADVSHQIVSLVWFRP